MICFPYNSIGLVFLLACLSVYDAKTYHVPYSLMIASYVWALFCVPLTALNFIYFMMIFLGLLCIKCLTDFFLKKNTLGFADVFILPLVCLFLPFDVWGWFFFGIGFLAFVYAKIFSKTYFPLMPFIFLSFIIVGFFKGSFDFFNIGA